MLENVMGDFCLEKNRLDVRPWVAQVHNWSHENDAKTVDLA